MTAIYNNRPCSYHDDKFRKATKGGSKTDFSGGGAMLEGRTCERESHGEGSGARLRAPELDFSHFLIQYKHFQDHIWQVWAVSYYCDEMFHRFVYILKTRN